MKSGCVEIALLFFTSVTIGYRLTTGSGISHPGLSLPGHGTGSGPGRDWKGFSGMGPG